MSNLRLVNTSVQAQDTHNSLLWTIAPTSSTIGSWKPLLILYPLLQNRVICVLDDISASIPTKSSHSLPSYPFLHVSSTLLSFSILFPQFSVAQFHDLKLFQNWRIMLMIKACQGLFLFKTKLQDVIRWGTSRSTE